MELIGQKRQKLGKKAKSLKKEGLVPGVVFGRGLESINISLDQHRFSKALEEAGETDLIDLKIEKNIYKVLIKDVQYDPITDKIIHAGFYKPDLTQKTQAQVPVTLVGEEQNELITSKEALALLLLQEITVEALPQDIPHEFLVDISDLNEIGQGITIAELDYNKEKVEIPDLDPEEYIVRLDYAEMEEIEEEEEVSEEEAIEMLEATEEKEGEEEEPSSAEAVEGKQPEENPSEE